MYLPVIPSKQALSMIKIRIVHVYINQFNDLDNDYIKLLFKTYKQPSGEIPRKINNITILFINS